MIVLNIYEIAGSYNRVGTRYERKRFNHSSQIIQIKTTCWSNHSINDGR